MQQASSFKKRFLELNRISDFSGWEFRPGMLFGSHLTWWSAGGRRRPHEGLDLLFYKTLRGEVKTLTEKMFVPAIYQGVIRQIADDYLGKSVFVEHAIKDSEDRLLYTIYGHLTPAEQIKKDFTIFEGEPIGGIAPLRNRDIPPHLHVSVAFVSARVPSGGLSWELMENSEDLILLDPMPFIS